MRFGSVCSGIEAASLAFEPLGWEPVFFSEMEPFPCAVLAHRWPDVPNLGDMTKIDGRQWRGKIDVLVGGTPCQAFSVAGLRQGLEDARGNLTLVFAELADAIKPSVVLWENVPGVLSDKTNAFGCLLGALAGEDDPLQPPGGKWTNAGFVLGPERAIAWRVLDAQYFGVAQRRRRVFVVACPRDGADPRAILFEREGLRRDTAPSREAGQGVAPTIRSGAANGGRGHGARSGDSKDELIVPCRMVAFGEYVSDGSGSTLKRRDHKDATDLVVAPAVIYQDSEFGCQAYETAGSMRAGRIPEHQMVLETIALQEVGKRTGKSTTDPRAGIGISGPGDPMYTLQSGAQHGVAIALRTDVTPKFQSDLAFTLTQPSPTGGGQPQAVAFHENQRAECTLSPTAGSLKAGGGKPGQGYPAVLSAMQVRRLTCKECERLQGMPDGHTQIPWRGKPAEECPDGPRYKAVGNSMAVPCMRWIGRRINEAND